MPLRTTAPLAVCTSQVSVVPQKIREAFGNHSYERRAVDPLAQAAALRALAATEIDAYLDPGDLASDRPTRFAVASGRRGRW